MQTTESLQHYTIENAVKYEEYELTVVHRFVRAAIGGSKNRPFPARVDIASGCASASRMALIP